MAITRHGINRADTGALVRPSFEETVEILVEAAMMGSRDDCHDIAEDVLFRQMAPWAWAPSVLSWTSTC